MMVVMAVAVPVVVTMHAAMAIGAPFRAERRTHLSHRRALMVEHVGDHVVAPDQQAVGLDLARQVPVAEVPGEAREVVGVATPDLEQVFLGSPDLDLPPVLQRQTVAIGQHGRMRQIDQHGKAAVGGQHGAPQVAGGVVEGQRVSRSTCRGRKGAGRDGLAHAAPRFIAAASAGRPRSRAK